MIDSATDIRINEKSSSKGPALKQKCASQSPEKLTVDNGSLNGHNTSRCSTSSLEETNNQASYKRSSSNYNGKSSAMSRYDEDADLFDPENPEFDGLIFKDTTNFSHTMHMMNVLRKNRQLCDLILQLDDDSQDIYCHQVVLACNSKFFMEIFNNYESNSHHRLPSLDQEIPSNSMPSETSREAESNKLG
jgi:hypothetical protein